MNIEFSIQNQILKRDDAAIIFNKSKNMYKCLFKFEETTDNEAWNNQNKFAIFTDSWGKSLTVHLGNAMGTLSCTVPDSIIDGTFFQVAVYAGDLITTNNIVIPLKSSGYNHRKHKCGNNKKDIFVEIFDRLDEVITDMAFSDKCLHLYRNEKLVETICMPFANETLVTELMQELETKANLDHVHSNATSTTDGFMSHLDKIKLDTIAESADDITVDDSLSNSSENPVQNKVIKSALDLKANDSDLSTIAKTGDFSDLGGVPESFTPTSHTHDSSDITDLGNTVDSDLNNLLSSLTEDIRKL